MYRLAWHACLPEARAPVVAGEIFAQIAAVPVMLGSVSILSLCISVRRLFIIAGAEHLEFTYREGRMLCIVVWQLV